MKHLDKAHLDYVNAIIVLDEDSIATGSRDRSIKVWDSKDWVMTLQAIIEEKVNCMLKLNNKFKNQVAVGTGNGKVLVLNSEDW